jgi:hypothetical protein
MACVDRMHSKQLNISNALRKTFGLAPIENAQNNRENHVGLLTMMPQPKLDLETPPFTPGLDRDDVGFSSFIDRIHSALTELGTWEARAVAFVLGEFYYQLGFYRVNASLDNPSHAILISRNTYILPRSCALFFYSFQLRQHDADHSYHLLKGCGIGVLLRMFWVFAILVVREFSPAAKDEHTEDAEYSLVIAEVDALPAYTDEKVPAYTTDEDKPDPEGA